MKVNTFIVGAPKAGTTSLHHYLNQHTDVSMSSVKEPNFFSSKEVESLFYNSKCIDDSNDYHKLFSKEKRQIRGEASVSYLFYENVPKRIYDYNSEAKIIIMLREPIERAFSHYLMDCRLGFCSEKLEDIIANPQSYPQYFQQYLELGNYYSQIKRYQDIFGKEQLLVIFYEDFKTNTEKVMNRVFSFLEIEQQEIDLSIKNPFLSPSNTLISKLYKFNIIRKGVKTIMPERLLSLIRSKYFSAKSKPMLSKATEQQLKVFYKSDVFQLEKLLNTDLARWNIK
ncbi:MAG: sulfotransferase family protein [Flavobacteriales bacterium]